MSAAVPAPPAARRFSPLLSAAPLALTLAAALWLLRALFVLRRPDLVRGWGDALAGTGWGALGDLGVALALAGLVLLMQRAAGRLAAWMLSALLLLALCGLSAVETEYFGFSRNRFDATFVAYAREWRTMQGSVSGQASPLFLVLHGALFLAAIALVFRLLRERPAPALSAALALLPLGIVLAWIPLAHPRQAATWFGAIAQRASFAELLRARRAAAAPPAEDDVRLREAFAATRSYSDPFHAKTFWSDEAPLVHLGARAPSGAFGPLPAKTNVVFMFLEGMEAASFGRSGSPLGLTPALDKLSQEGLYFRHFFANGAHTPRALDAALCGLYPRLVGAPLSRAQPTMPVHCLPQVLREHGYQTTFVHGGLENFENRFEFLGHIGFGQTTFFEQFPPGTPKSNGGWGATDRQIYDQSLAWIDRRDKAQPFFLTVLSISNHHPFRVPDPALELEHDEKLRPNNTIRYADREAARFIEELRSRGLLDDTLVFVFGDHGLTRENLNGDSQAAMHEMLLRRANVPLIVLGPKGSIPVRQVDRVASQVDLMPTVLDALGLDVPTHAMGQSLGWTWAADRDLPAFLHDLYSGVAATVTPGDSSIVALGEEHAGETSHAAWQQAEDGRISAQVIPRDEGRDAQLRNLVTTVDQLYAQERWWSPKAQSWTSAAPLAASGAR